jgi:hypothetical protein
MAKRERHDRQISLRLPRSLVAKVTRAAKSERRSLSSMFEVIVAKWAERYR